MRLECFFLDRYVSRLSYEALTTHFGPWATKLWVYKVCGGREWGRPKTTFSLRILNSLKIESSTLYYLLDTWYKVSLENCVLTYWRITTPEIILQLTWEKFYEIFQKNLSTMGLEFIARFYLVLVETKHTVQQINRHVWSQVWLGGVIIWYPIF